MLLHVPYKVAAPRRTLKTPEVRDRLLQHDTQKWTRLIQAKRIKAE